jgi:hypothetical protein
VGSRGEVNTRYGEERRRYERCCKGGSKGMGSECGIRPKMKVEGTVMKKAQGKGKF